MSASDGHADVTPELLKRLIPEMVAAYESESVRRAIAQAAQRDDRLEVMRIAMRAQADVLRRHGVDPATGLRAVAEAARRHRDDPELVELGNQLRWRLTALFHESRAARGAPRGPHTVQLEPRPPAGGAERRAPPS